MFNPFQIPSNLSVKARGYAEAILKTIEGQRLLDEGMAELAHLDGRKANNRTGGGRDVTLPTPRKRGRGGATVDDVLKVLAKGPHTSTEIAEAAGCSSSYVRLVLKADPRVGRIGVGNRAQWILSGIGEKSVLKRRSSKTVAPRTARRTKVHGAFLLPETKFDEMTKAIKAGNGWASIGTLNKETGLSRPVVHRVLKAMKKAKLIECVTKADNPAHKACPRILHREARYWVMA